VSRRGSVLFAAMSVIWGIPYLLIKVADGGVSVPVLVFSRVAVGALLLLPVALRGRQLGALRGHWRWLIAFALFEIIGPFALLSSAEKRLASSTTGLLVAAVPIIGAVLAQFTGGQDRLTPIRWTGLIVGFGGVAVLAGPDAAHGDALSVAEVLLTALGYAIGPMIANRKLQAVPPAAVNTVCLGLAALVYAVPAALSLPPAVPSAKVILSLLGLGAICTATAFLVFFALIAEVGPARATVITYVNPAFCAMTGFSDNELVEQIATALAEREDHVVAGIGQRRGDVGAALFQRAGDAFRDFVDARGDRVRDQRDVVAQVDLHA